ncbi:hypothetical protein [Dyadobacter sp.]|uniref:hypothetical protein n=1 Tax=Dyadobacter sp. TaxID=1914288 RepID=UPI003F72B2AF
MKLYIITLMALLISADISAQVLTYDQKRLNKYAKKLARQELYESLIKVDELSKIMAYSITLSLKYIPVLSFIVGPRGVEYDSTKNFVEYLIPNENFAIELAILTRQKKFHGTINCFDKVNFSSCEVCNYNYSVKEGPNFYNYEMKQNWKEISKRKYSLLFTIKNFRSSIWIIEKKQVFVFDTEQKMFYKPDDYIKTHCSAKQIRDMAEGKSVQFCN